ncbi:hypothetical protein H9L17_02630 [Thermomonas brevis]|uniref:Teneurin-like YD-shell domain-containing protein n=1 Tax=Thermomonas brevis TaxID=215691 RepID=A0A7G9QUQ6_9GAMM|nr:RHS repeat-associated core domain-containing protein [Thermomonas brevis]QNN47081.1 hypothetical protein H9L17_02630 [Thermomonas brevis]
MAYRYDTADNLTRVWIDGGNLPRDHTYCYNTTTNRLDFVRNGTNCASSPAAITLAYDVQGNLSGKNGTAYAFDYGNRLRSTAGLTYRYDADGRRVRQDSAGSQLKYSYYAKDGRLVWQRDEPAGKRINNVYFAGSLLSEISRPIGTDTVTFSYFHTDALGSPIAKTNSAGTPIERSEYEPYGKLVNRANDDRAGYTGHVMDSASGLTYMQQRYYDPQCGCFLSVDPVTAYSTGDMRFFGRYVYANNNPYKFTDPDGRQSAADRFGDQFKRDAEAGNLRVYAPFEKPAILVTAAMLGGPLAEPLYARAMVWAGSNYGKLMLGGEMAAGAAGVSGVSGSNGLMGQAANVLKPEGQLLGRAGTSNAIRLIEGGMAEAKATFSQATRGGEVVKNSTYPGTLVRVGENALVGFRESSTRGSQPPTIDLMGSAWKGFGAREFKFLQESQ